MKQKILAMFIAFTGMLLCTSLVHAGQITSSHSIVSAVSVPSGTDVTLNISISNNSAVTYTNLTVAGVRDFTPIDPVADSLQITILPTGQTVTAAWNFTINSPTMPDSQGYIRLLLSGFDDGGNQVTIPVSSKEVVK